MAYKKTCWYTVIAPLRIGRHLRRAPGAGPPLDGELIPLVELGFLAGIAFQIHDDLLNLEADEDLYGKEIGGDLWEGKRTVMLLHFLRAAEPRARARALRLLRTRARASCRRTSTGCAGRWTRRARSSTGAPGTWSTRSARSRWTTERSDLAATTTTAASSARCCSTSSSV